jgi:hypothetical protein
MKYNSGDSLSRRCLDNGSATEMLGSMMLAGWVRT